jgi:hypothetical protein
MIRYTFAAAALIAMSLGTLRAEQISWEQFYATFKAKRPSCSEGLIENRSISVFTRAGHKCHSESLCIAPDQARLDCGGQETLASADIERIEIWGAQRFLDFTVASAVLPVGGALYNCGVNLEGGGDRHCNPLKFAGTLAMLSPMWAVAAVSAPVTLAMDAVSRIHPPRKFEFAAQLRSIQGDSH